MRKLRSVVTNVRSVLAVELVCAAQALDLRGDIASPSAAVAAAAAVLRSQVPRMDVDRMVAPQLVAADALLPEMVVAAEQVAGPLA